QALDTGEKILVYGDADTDGICATALLVETLRDLSGQVSYLIPDRTKDGVGLKTYFLEKAQQNGVKLIITVDCGITNFEQVEYAKQLGLDVIITDHHEPLDRLPSALAVLNPKRKDCPYPFKLLSGAGVAYKLAQALAMSKIGLSQSQWHSVKKDLLGLVLLGTIGDRVPLLGENRIFMVHGLKALAKSTCPWLKAIQKVTHLDPNNWDINSILAYFVPLLSAGASDNGHNKSCQLLLSHDQQQAEAWAAELYLSSQQWQQKARQAYSRIRSLIPSDRSAKLLLVTDQEATIDILGYCASRLKDTYLRPAIVIGFKGNYAVGEARAPKEFDLMDCLKCCAELFIDYGGHRSAAGFLMDSAKLDQLKSQVQNYIQNWHIPLAQLEIEVEMPITELTSSLITEIQILAPFGEGNPEPLFLSKDIYVEKSTKGYHNICGSNFILQADRKAKYRWLYPLGLPVKVDLVYLINEKGELVFKDFEPKGYLARKYSGEKLS
ncbi:MAG: DHH family phosphoesterase, partial [candidate division KSB1 bacterium]|nr:DHH family phosphoesterase [candidate division KSB1 bacterium]